MHCNNKYWRKKVIKKINLPFFKINWDKKIAIQNSENDRFIAIYNIFGQFSYIFDLETTEIILELDRKEYHSEQSKFPICFFSAEQIDYLIHGTDWNHLDIFALNERKSITNRTYEFEEGYYLDYFYGDLHLSSNKEWILTSGWIWGAASKIKFINIINWLHNNKYEPEIPNNYSINFDSYYWDRALCWLNGQTIAYLYHTKEEGGEPLEEEYYKNNKLEFGKSYILYYDFLQSKITEQIEFSSFSTD